MLCCFAVAYECKFALTVKKRIKIDITILIVMLIYITQED